MKKYIIISHNHIPNPFDRAPLQMGHPYLIDKTHVYPWASVVCADFLGLNPPFLLSPFDKSFHFPRLFLSLLFTYKSRVFQSPFLVGQKSFLVSAI